VKWQEYQDAVATLYEQVDGFGHVERNVYIPDRITGQPRQIDVLIRISDRGHTLTVIVDAKFHETKLDVKDIEEVMALASAVGGSKACIVAANGWTEPAQRKAEHCDVDLRILTIEHALDVLVPEKWSMCPACKKDCIILDHDGACEYHGAWLWWLAGQCRECRFGFAWCQDCGENMGISLNESRECNCGHIWRSHSDGMAVKLMDQLVETEI